MENEKQTHRLKPYLWFFGGLILIFTLLTGATVGGVAGYVVANRWVASPVDQNLALTEVVPDPVAALDLTLIEAQPPLVVDESDSVEAVQQVLPAVVTVINQQGRFAGGSGSGFFVNEAGYLVTNNHVIEGAAELSVIYAQGGTASATLVGRAPEFDLAVLKVDGVVPAVAGWGDSGELPLGANVIAIGSALGRYHLRATAD